MSAKSEDRKKRKGWTEFQVHLMDEIPAIGCGHRRVLAVVGWKWVKVVAKHYGGNAARISRKKWDEIGAKPITN